MKNELDLNMNVVNMEMLKALRSQKEMSDVTFANIEHIYNEMANMRDEMQYTLVEVKDMKNEIVGVKDEVKELKQEIDDNVFLLPGQIETLRNIIHKKSSFVAKEVYGYGLDANGISKAIGKVRPAFWSLLKQHCGNAARYTMIRRKDYEKAVTFAEGLTPQDFINRWGKYGIPTI